MVFPSFHRCHVDGRKLYSTLRVDVYILKTRKQKSQFSETRGQGQKWQKKTKNLKRSITFKFSP